MPKLRRRTLVAGVAAALALVAGSITILMAASEGDSDFDKVKSAVEGFDTTAAAEAAGWGLVPGLDHCFDHEGHGGMGVHYINTGLLDTTLDSTRPEALVFHHRADGSLVLGAVEYIVPIDQWTANTPPTVLGQLLTPNTDLGVYKLHAWIFTKNPSGVHSDFNPDVSCLAEG